ncbi:MULTISPECIES: L-idonate 5-dehydrogenase [unclassified Rhizobium]|uniref:L-idonate 5-dehydrogenase n=1 Tax=unclassified Rhizobium TaxID=2613769 RepID=UPI000DE01BCA|nr:MULTISPECIES: L-idonate 5-dehydrogenase [unclassified Rhizobium]MBB3286980.1 L-idonate 5-dehydrogenase [Rhizobium sp. BK252]MBB3401720.1 L-idonate 5-dehydrogenase [Rhizobium sp. BK289]MBB3414336.1 L-idonate 5-dehydrogenase [Rhizobium sp. BK284]MBB3482224.1 L-idonate 5-dehydrogenase [Rhizobium sp. BK347]
MKTRACVLHAQGDIRIEERNVGAVGDSQVLVRVGAGGICGSDIHYFWDGGIGTIRVTEPIILGHEVAGTVEAIGASVGNVKPGDRVALCPSRPCGRCRFCQAGQQQHCLEMQFFGSAMRKPHCDGGFRDLIVVEDFQCEPVGEAALDEAACAEPLSVGLHAINNAGSLLGKSVVVMGAGPIGALLIGAARMAGAREVVAVDLAEAPLKAAKKMGATLAINGGDGDRLAGYSEDKGYFDVGFECTGSGIALGNLFPIVKPRGTIVAVGVSNGSHIPFNALVGKEIRLVGTHRFHSEYALAARMIAERRIDVRPIITSTVPMEHIREAFDIVRDRTTQMKVQLSFAT